MNDLIQDELRRVLNAWRSGKPVQSIEIGHSTRVNDAGEEERHVFHQRKAHECVFHLIEYSLDAVPGFARFNELSQEFGRSFQLTEEERIAAESLAWVALHRGWTRAIAGHKEERSITLTAEAQA